AAAQQAVDAYRVNGQIRTIGVYDRDGKLMAGYDRSGTPAAATIATMMPAPSYDIRVAAPIVQTGQHLGTVYLDVDKEQGFRAGARYFVLFGMFLLAALVVATLGLAQNQLGRANRELEDRA